MIDGVLNDARRTQTAPNACLHDALVEEGSMATVKKPPARASP